MYAHRYFSEAAKQQMLEMIKYLKEAFSTILTDIGEFLRKAICKIL